MIIKILMVVAVIVVAFLIAAALQPADFKITRSMAMSAAPSIIFPHVNDLHSWEAWSPWAKMDPNAKSTFNGPAAGAGASMHWAGNTKVGEGTMTIVGSRPNEGIQLKLEFLKPFAATNQAEFTFKPEGGKTLVTWSMSGHNNFIGKAMGLIINCDKMVGGQFEKGLTDLKSIVEGAGKSSR